MVKPALVEPHPSGLAKVLRHHGTIGRMRRFGTNGVSVPKDTTSQRCRNGR